MTNTHTHTPFVVDFVNPSCCLRVFFPEYTPEIAKPHDATSKHHHVFLIMHGRGDGDAVSRVTTCHRKHGWQKNGSSIVK